MSIMHVFPKCPVCGSTSGYAISGIFGKYAKCANCMTKWKLLVKNNEIVGLMLHELPKNGSGLFKIKSTNSPLYSIMGLPLDTTFWKNLELDGKIDWDYLSKSFNPAAWDSVTKHYSERFLHCWVGYCIIHGITIVNGNSRQVVKTYNGILLLTDRRLIWLNSNNKRYESFEVKIIIPVECIQGISGESGDSSNWCGFKKIVIATDDGPFEFSLKSGLIELVKPMIENVITSVREKLAILRRLDRLGVTVDFSFLKKYMEKGGLLMQALRCPHCDGPIDFPKTGNVTTCPYCGTSIYAQNIFDKLKSLENL